MFRYYFRKSIVCPATYISAALLFLSIVLSLDSEASAQPAYLFDSAYAMGLTAYFLPVASVLPISFLRHALRKGGAWQFPLMHSSPRRYTLEGLAAAFVSGALVLLLSAALFHLYIVLFLKGPVSYEDSLFQGIYFYSRMSNRAGYLVRIGVYAVNAGMYAVIAYGVSGLSANQYICAASGFAFWISASVLAQTAARFAPENARLVFYALDPGQCTPGGVMTQTRDGGLIHLAVYVLVIVLLAGGGFYLRLRRRLRHG